MVHRENLMGMENQKQEQESPRIAPLIGEKIYQPDEDRTDSAQPEAGSIEEPKKLSNHEQIKEARSVALELIKEQDGEEQNRQAKAQVEASTIERGDLNMSRNAESSDEGFIRIITPNDITAWYRNQIAELKRKSFLANLMLETLETNSDEYRSAQNRINETYDVCRRLEEEERLVSAYESMDESERRHRIFELAERIVGLVNTPEVRDSVMAGLDYEIAVSKGYADYSGDKQHKEALNKALQEKKDMEQEFSKFHSFKPANPDQFQAIVLKYYYGEPEYEFGLVSNEQSVNLSASRENSFYLQGITPCEIDPRIWGEVVDRLGSDELDLLKTLYLKALCVYQMGGPQFA